MAVMPSRRTQLRTHPIVQLIGLIVVSIVAIVGALDGYKVLTAVALEPAGLAADPPIGHAVRVACTNAVIDSGLRVAGDDADDGAYLALCPLGDRNLVVISDAPVATRALTGKLQRITGEEVWATAKLPGTYRMAYLDLTTQGEDRLLTAMVTLLGLGAIAGWWLFARRYLRERARRQVA